MLDLAQAIDEQGLASKLLLQVHDELILECPDGEVEQMKELLTKVMANAVELSVPLRVSGESGSSWGVMH